MLLGFKDKSNDIKHKYIEEVEGNIDRDYYFKMNGDKLK